MKSIMNIVEDIMDQLIGVYHLKSGGQEEDSEDINSLEEKTMVKEKLDEEAEREIKEAEELNKEADKIMEKAKSLFI